MSATREVTDSWRGAAVRFERVREEELSTSSASSSHSPPTYASSSVDDSGVELADLEHTRIHVEADAPPSDQPEVRHTNARTIMRACSDEGMPRI
jgi:hypothetical protein